MQVGFEVSFGLVSHLLEYWFGVCEVGMYLCHIGFIWFVFEVVLCGGQVFVQGWCNLDLLVFGVVCRCRDHGSADLIVCKWL